MFWIDRLETVRYKLDKLRQLAFSQYGLHNPKQQIVSLRQLLLRRHITLSIYQIIYYWEMQER